MTIVFKILAQKYPNKTFLVPNLGIFVFFAKFSNEANSRVLISNMTIVFFKVLAQKYQNKAFLVKNSEIRHFWSQIQEFWLFREILQIDKFEGADFKYHNSFKILAHKYQISHFWSEIQAFSLFHDILQLDKFKSCDFKYDIKHFLSFKIDNKGNSFLVNYCIVK